MNFQILKEGIDRSLKQSNQDYSIAYKNAAVAWESDKQSLIAAWDAELILMKRDQAFDEQIVKELAIEVSLRAIELTNAKTVIEREAESIRKEMAELDGSTGEYEIELANAKLLTAQKKLEVIPFLEQLLTIEGQLIDKEYQLADKSMIIAGIVASGIEKEYEILNIEQQIAVLAGEVAGKVSELTVLETETVEKNVEIAVISGSISDAIGELVAKDTEIIAKNAELIVLQESIVPLLEDIAAKDTEIIGKETKIIEASTLIVNMIRPIIAVDEQIITESGKFEALENQIADKLREIVNSGSEVIDKNLELVNISNLISDVMGRVADKDSGIIVKNQAILDAQDLIVDVLDKMSGKDAEIIVKENIIINNSKLISKVISDIILKDDEIIIESGKIEEAEKEIAIRLKEIVNRGSEVIAKNSLLITASELIADVLVTMAGKDSEIIVKNQELVGLKQAIVAILEEFAAKDEELIGREDDLITEKGIVLTKIETLVDKEKLVVDQADKTVLAKDETVNELSLLMTAKELVIDARASLIENDEQELLDAQQTYVDDRVEKIDPLLTSLVEEMDALVIELDVQIDLYDQIAEKKGEIVGVKEQQAVKQDAIIVAKRLVAEAITELAGLTEGLMDYQIEKLAPAISNLITIYETYAEEIGDQTQFKIEIAKIKKRFAENIIPKQVKGEMDVSQAQIDLETQSSLLRTAELAIVSQNSKNKKAKFDQIETDTGIYKTEWGEAEGDSLSDRAAMVSGVISKDKLRNDLQVSTRTRNALRVDGKAISSTQHKASDYGRYEKRRAEIQTAAEGVTAQLKHLLSQD